ncbi:hypothetical protein ES708_21425 [subsurface metagenome]
MTKKYIHRASADVGFMMTAYNLRRIINIIGIRRFKEYLKMRLTLLLTIFGLKDLNRGLLKGYYFQTIFRKSILEPVLKRLYLTHKLTFSGGF